MLREILAALDRGPLTTDEVRAAVGGRVHRVRKLLGVLRQTGEIRRYPRWVSRYGYVWVHERVRDRRRST